MWREYSMLPVSPADRLLPVFVATAVKERMTAAMRLII